MEPPRLDAGPRALRSWIRGVLASTGARPRKRLGQHFLVHPRGLEYFAREVDGGDWLEVGPGPGLLTLAVAPRASRLVAFELDPVMACIAASIAPGNASIVVGDGVAAASTLPAEALISNTPFNISTVIVAAAARNNSLSRSVLGVQFEVALRMVAEPGSPEYGRLTLLVRRYFKARIVARIPSSWFYPPPEVDAAIVVLERARPWRPGDEAFEELTACMFSRRNKLAYKVAEECACVDREEARRRLGSRRVRELDVGDLEWMLESGACTRRRG